MNDSSGHPDRKLQQAFGNSLFDAAERLVQSGAVLEVRVLQGGNVVTGIVGVEMSADAGAAASGQRATKYRVYIRNLTSQMQGECSCGERGVCVHVAAVSIAAVRTGSRAFGAAGARGLDDARTNGVATGGAAAPPSGVGAGLAQLLCYVVEKRGSTGIFGENAEMSS